MTKYDDVASRMIERRAQLGWSQEQLSKESGVAAAQISRYEARINKPRANVTAKLAKGLMVPFAWLANGDTSEFRLDDAPNGFMDLMINIPGDIVDALSKAAAAHGMSEDEYMIKALEESLKKDISRDKKPTKASTMYGKHE